MKITRVAATPLTASSTNDRFPREARGPRPAAVIEIHTGAGVTGLGETYAGYFCPEVVPWIAGAALDTHYAYPLPPEHPLWRYSNVERYLTGAPLLNRLTATQLNGA
jgi:L-alanine-DL-glutamate epimerase-like enolase superfamily enzyme